MMNMELFCITYLVASVAKVILATDESDIIDYFNSDTFNTIQTHWKAERKSFESALVLILEQNYGSQGMNVYVRRMPDYFKVSDGFYFTDNVVSLIFLKTSIQELPHLIAPEVTFILASNYLHIEAGLGRMIINSVYLMMRNQSDVVFTASEQDATKYSPFSFQQVQESGGLTIVAQDCKLTGYTIASFTGNTVNLGMDTFKVSNCKFSVEIYSKGVGSPPVFGPYFSKQQSIALETMLTKPIRAELLPKLQAAVFSYINTSAIFGDKLPQLRFHQNSIFKKTFNYMRGIVGKFVQNTIKKSQGIMKLKPVQVMWNKTCASGTCGFFIKLNDVNLYGLDTAYSAHIGGPFKLESPKVAETIRFSTMQVRGKIYFENSTTNAEHEFSVELRDVEVNVEMDAKSGTFVSTNIDVVGWRTLEFSIIDMYTLEYERRAAKSLITGYLVNEIPKSLLNQLTETFGKVKSGNEQLDANVSHKCSNIQIKEESDNGKKQKKKKDDGETETNPNVNDALNHVYDTLPGTELNYVEDATESPAPILSDLSDD